MASSVSRVVVPRSKTDYTISITEISLGTYTTGGVTVTPAQLGLTYVKFAECTRMTKGTGSYNTVNLFYNVATQKVLVYTTSATEISNGTDLTTMNIQILAWGG